MMYTPHTVKSSARQPRFYKITPKQESFLLRLLDDERKDHDAVGVTEDVKEDVTERLAARPCAVSKREASALIDKLMNAPWKPKPKPAAKRDVEEGFYTREADGTVEVAKVQRAVHGSGNLYAKLLDDAGSFVYTRGLIGRIRSQDGWKALTLDEAKRLGKLYGRCMVCGRTLTNEQSIQDGIGPICASRF